MLLATQRESSVAGAAPMPRAPRTVVRPAKLAAIEGTVMLGAPEQRGLRLRRLAVAPEERQDARVADRLGAMHHRADELLEHLASRCGSRRRSGSGDISRCAMPSGSSTLGQFGRQLGDSAGDRLARSGSGRRRHRCASSSQPVPNSTNSSATKALQGDALVRAASPDRAPSRPPRRGSPAPACSAMPLRSGQNSSRSTRLSSISGPMRRNSSAGIGEQPSNGTGLRAVLQRCVRRRVAQSAPTFESRATATLRRTGRTPGRMKPRSTAARDHARDARRLLRQNRGGDARREQQPASTTHQSDSRKAIRSSRVDFGHFANASRDACASPPCQRMASVRFRARPSCRNSVWSGHRLGQPDAPQRRRAPLVAVGIALGPMIGEPLAHVVQQEVGIGPDQLELVRLVRRIARGDELRRVAGDAAGFVERLLAAQHCGIVRCRAAAARRGSANRTSRGRAPDRALRRHRAAPARRSARRGTRPAPPCSRHSGWLTSGVEMPMSPAKALADCDADRRRAGLPAEAAERQLLRSRDRAPCWACPKCRRRRHRRDRRCARMSSVGNLLEQPEPDHLRRDARREHHVRR